ncbi:enoyl-CoA hydratase/isomerase family protein [Actinomadura viridis]|uniref:enoyl-CoA hydratase/isomerase family protein n=1 Tax=Actinomadura viridis TaxID=58110 RepID=UPI003698A7FE
MTPNRPERRNAYGRQVRDALVEALTIAVFAPEICVVVDGAGPAFCSGGDLTEFGTAPDQVTAHLVRTRGGVARLIHALRDRIEVKVHGACVGAGGTVSLPRRIGRQRTLYLALTGRPLDTATARARGLVDAHSTRQARPDRALA